MKKYWNWKEIKETEGFKIFKNDYIRIFLIHHPRILKKIDGYKQPRIFETDKHEKQSILNYINTNVLAYSIIVNETLKLIDFDPTTKDGYEIMMSYIINNESFWLSILPKIKDKIKYTSELGNKKEELVRNKLNEYFKVKGKFKVVSYGELGGLTDMNNGVDMVISNENDKIYTAQVKYCKSITLHDDTYKISYNGINKLYRDLNYFIFVVGENVNVFDNKMILVDEDGYKCDVKGLKIVL